MLVRDGRIRTLIVGGNKHGKATWRKDLVVAYKTENIYPYDPAISRQGTYPRKMKAYDHRNTYMIPFI